jgi:DNA modification methylase
LAEIGHTQFKGGSVNGLRLEWIDPKTLTPNPKNWRRHPEHQRDALADVLGEVGWAGAALYNEQTGKLVDGHLRLDVALRRGDEAIPVLVGSWDAADEAKILATLDPIAALATADAAALDSLLREVNTGSAAVMDMLAELAEGAGLYAEPVTGAGGDEFDTTPDDGPTRAQRGDLWQMGEHRLLVDDCTIAANVARLMGGEKAGGVFTSPPYLQQRTYAGNMAADWYSLMEGMSAAMLEAVEDGAQIFVNLGLVHRDGRVIRYWDSWIDCLEAQGVPLFGWYVWDKTFGFPGDWNGRLALAHEWIYHFTSEGERPKKTVATKHAGTVNNSNTQRQADGTTKAFGSRGEAIQPFKIPDSVIRLAPQQARNLDTSHPAMFPVGLPTVFIEAWATIGAWFDPFLGSGTTLIAAERLGRKCYGCEIEPRYADVILRRWEAETGREAALVERLGELASG